MSASARFTLGVLIIAAGLALCIPSVIGGLTALGLPLLGIGTHIVGNVVLDARGIQ